MKTALAVYYRFMDEKTWTKEEVLDEAKRVRETLREMFVRDGALRATTWLYGTRNPDTGEPEKTLVLMPVVGDFDVRQRDFYAVMLRLAGVACGAVGIIFASEIWTVDPEYQKEIGPERAGKELREWVGSLENHPRRMEAVWVTLEHHRLGGSYHWMAKITRDADGQPTLHEWDHEHFVTGERHGRFANMLPPVN